MPKASNPDRPRFFFFFFFFIALTWLDVVRYRAAISPFYPSPWTRSRGWKRRYVRPGKRLNLATIRRGEGRVSHATADTFVVTTG